MIDHYMILLGDTVYILYGIFLPRNVSGDAIHDSVIKKKCYLKRSVSPGDMILRLLPALLLLAKICSTCNILS